VFIADSRPNDMLELARETLTQYLHEQSGEDLQSVKVLRFCPKPFSMTSFLEAHTDRATRRFVIKEIVKHPMNASIVIEAEQAMVEFNILTFLYPRFADVERCSVPKPVALLAERDAFIMEHVAGNLLATDLRFERYFTATKGFQALQQHFHECGKWLRHLHAFTGVSDAGPDAVDCCVRRCDNALRQIEQSADRRCPRELRSLVERFLQEQVGQLEGAQIPVTGRHGDFGPWNILVDPNGITVLDFFGFQDDIIAVDILKMLWHFEASSLRPLGSPGRLRAFRASFLAGLGPLPQVPAPALLLCEAMHRICSIAGVVSVRGSSLLANIHRGRYLRANLDWFMSERRRSLWPVENE
jgi:hypothetical protein